MKKILLIILIPIILSGCNTNTNNNFYTTSKNNKKISVFSIKGIWISFYELDFADKSENYFINKTNSIFSDIKSKGFNSVFVHVRSHSDAYYKSEFFPFSEIIAGKQGVNPGFDPLEIMCYFAKIHKLQIHAWINPFRITATSDISHLSIKNPAYSLIKSNSREVRKTSSGYYYNPCYDSVQKLICDGVEEIAKKYNVDGIHFDDYFYPTVDKKFDKKEFSIFNSKNSTNITLEQWRRQNIDKLIRKVYSTAHKYNKIFGISPHCSFYYNYNIQFADIEKWCKSTGYIDYIAPQIYFDFETNEKTEDNQSLSFAKCLKYWKRRVGNTPMYIGLALYKSGESGEWAEKNDVIARQIKHLNKSNLNGFIIFSYSYLEKCKKETENMIKVIKQADNLS